MTSTRPVAHVAVYDGYADAEIAHLLDELHTGRFTRASFTIVTVAESDEPVTSMGGLRVLPDELLARLDPDASTVLVLPGAEMWDQGQGAPFAAAASRFLDANVPVAAICGATVGLARVGLLDERKHTSSSPEYLSASGYAGSAHYLDERCHRRRPDHSRATVTCPVRARDALAPRHRIRAHAPGLRRPVPQRRPVGVPRSHASSRGEPDMSAIGDSRAADVGGKVLVIVGGTSGIGARTPELAAEQGATVVVAGRRRADGEAIAARIGGRYDAVDVRSEQAIAHLLARAAEAFGRIDCLVNCAGESGALSGIETIELEALASTFMLHVGGVVSGMKHVAPIMLAQVMSMTGLSERLTVADSLDDLLADS
jgi:putative intracellular protease/amidase